MERFVIGFNRVRLSGAHGGKKKDQKEENEDADDEGKISQNVLGKILGIDLEELRGFGTVNLN
jgi:hypothetical protein